MMFDTQKLQWLNPPKQFVITENSVEITTEPHTDLWQKTYYHFQNDNAPMLQFETAEPYFSFVVKTDFSSAKQRFDQCGIVLYLDSENWLKASVEYENEQFQHLGSVVTNNGYSDWAITKIGLNIKQMWYRLSRRKDDFRIECSQDGVHFAPIRICHLNKATDKIRFGLYACSPENSSFTAVFSEMRMDECIWKKHDGQQPDEEQGE
ncbi:DUF1349 domain-containing protein [Bibersteinia trehalosi]|nr:DUF1349 domain-containing protein [Bibersteinia trehalosi]